MTSINQFYEAIRANPNDESLLLIFCDWLEENGQLDRADFIRDSIKQDHLPLNDPRRRELLVRLRLMEYNLRNNPQIIGVVWGEAIKGLTRSVYVYNVETLRKHAATIIESAPLLTLTLNIYNKNDIAQLHHIPELSKFRDLHISSRSNTFGNDGLQLLTKVPWLRQLRRLELYRVGIGARGVHMLTESRLSENLESLNLCSSRVGILGARSLGCSQNWGKLERLILETSRMSLKELSEMVPDHVHLKSLKELSLRFNPLHNEGVSFLARSPLLKQLKKLDLSGIGMTYDGLAALSKSDMVSGLQELLIAHNPIGGPALYQFARSAKFASLEVLNLGQLRFAPHDAVELIRSPYFPKLKTIHFAKDFVEPQAVKMLEDRFGSNGVIDFVQLPMDIGMTSLS